MSWAFLLPTSYFISNVSLLQILPNLYHPNLKNLTYLPGQLAPSCYRFLELRKIEPVFPMSPSFA